MQILTIAAWAMSRPAEKVYMDAHLRHEQPWSNPVVYKITGQHVHQTKVQNVNDLKQRLIDVWAGVEQSVIGDGIDVFMTAFEPIEGMLTIHYDT